MLIAVRLDIKALQEKRLGRFPSSNPLLNLTTE
jgi:hypothetical protein